MFVAFAHVPLAFAILCVDCQSCGMVKVGACHPLKKETVQLHAIFEFFEELGNTVNAAPAGIWARYQMLGSSDFFEKKINLM